MGKVELDETVAVVDWSHARIWLEGRILMEVEGQEGTGRRRGADVGSGYIVTFLPFSRRRSRRHR